AFVSAGVGYGGSCFPKDVQALIRIADRAKFDFGILKQAEEVNKEQKKLAVKGAKKLLKTLKGKKVAIWGLAFKPKTDDLREAVSLTVVKSLVRSGAKVKAYDPVAMTDAEGELPKIQYAKTAFEAVKNADALIVLTEWDEFKQVDLKRLKKELKSPNVFDGRNIYDPEEMKELGFNYISVGRK
ncbi:UDP-glucose 6-dehydrogenase, partial [Patescibacteria group bacterium]|nr:UDP-glucose 6-dehydrogenase [Patescibacteria group bacterium]